MFYFLSRSFSPHIALPCTLSLSLMTYHIYLSQDARSYSFLMFLGMAGLYFFLKHLKTSKKRYLVLVGFFFASLFYTSYSSLLFIALSQILWFYQATEKGYKKLYSFLILNGLIFLLCVPWVLFIALNYNGQPLMDTYQARAPISLEDILGGIFHDWMPHFPLIITSIILLILFPLFSKNRRNTLILLAVYVFPIITLYLFCKLSNVNHFITSRYFINFLPLFLILLYLSLTTIQDKFVKLKGMVHLSLLFFILFLVFNLTILPFYYKCEKQNLRGLVLSLRGQLRDGDKVFLGGEPLFTGVLHYFRIYPEGRHYALPVLRDLKKRVDSITIPIFDNNRIFLVYNSKYYLARYVSDESRLWITVGGKEPAKAIKKIYPAVLKGYFDGSFLNFNRFPTDASLYLFLLDPQSPGEKGIDIPIE